MRPAKRIASQRARQGASVVACAVAVTVAVMVVAAAGSGRAEPVNGPAGTGSGTGAASAPVQVAPTAAVAVSPLAPLTALSVVGEALTCVQSPVALDAECRAGVLAPKVVATVIRGSAAPSPSVTWVVVPLGRSGSDSNVVVMVCSPTR